MNPGPLAPEARIIPLDQAADVMLTCSEKLGNMDLVGAGTARESPFVMARLRPASQEENLGDYLLSAPVRNLCRAKCQVGGFITFALSFLFKFVKKLAFVLVRVDASFGYMFW